VMIFQSAPTPFSLTFSESTWAASSFESTRHLWKVFRWWFSSRHLWKVFRWRFPSRHRLRFHWWIHASRLKVVLLTCSESRGAASASESASHLWNSFRWRFPSRYRLCYCWLFQSQ
jgi:hypothetical protein